MNPMPPLESGALPFTTFTFCSSSDRSSKCSWSLIFYVPLPWAVLAGSGLPSALPTCAAAHVGHGVTVHQMWEFGVHQLFRQIAACRYFCGTVLEVWKYGKDLGKCNKTCRGEGGSFFLLVIWVRRGASNTTVPRSFGENMLLSVYSLRTILDG